MKLELLAIDVPRILPPPVGGGLEVELGSADARFLRERAREEPGGSYLGVEIRREMVERANRECAREGLIQVRSVFANMSTDLPRLFERRSVRRFFVNFPDPWFKSRQRKRRVLGAALVANMESCLAADGEIFVMTDVFNLALDAMAELESSHCENLAGPWSFVRESPFRARSRRERQCESEGKRIWRLSYRLRGAAGHEAREALDVERGPTRLLASSR